MIRRPPRSTQSRSSAAADVYKRQIEVDCTACGGLGLCLRLGVRGGPTEHAKVLVTTAGSEGVHETTEVHTRSGASPGHGRKLSGSWPVSYTHLTLTTTDTV
eukprot:TRINITY_DN4956_c0_g1_i1.p1 TRINITY_DN4956_c0_g1~~TRINITY_DN4956_c0_g1_i1.p1  ORF type:complete len:102 (-),score=37.26 TRINITY_DN4956_c0_g1_i1:48-353(-)